MRVLLLLPLLVLGMLVGPGVAGACACGAVLADQRLDGVNETALIELGDGQESITVNIGARTESGEVAFVMPVPARAEFALADGAVFGELDEFSAPRVEYREVEVDGEGGAGASAPDRGVTVLDHTEVGPFEVAQLSGVDSGAVADWLGSNDFVLPDDLAAALTPYLADGWLVAAVRLTPRDVATFADGLPPMRFTFATAEPVYPMRLSATAEYAQPLRLYVLADHRVDVSDPGGGTPDLTFAGWMEPASLGDYPALAAAVGSRRFLTRYDATLHPIDIADDIRFTRAATDGAYRAVVVEKRYVSGVSAGVVVSWIMVGVVVSGGLTWYWKRRRPAADGG